MARNKYKINFKDKTIIYSNSEEHKDNSLPFRIMNKGEMKIMRLTLFDIKEATFSCTEEEFYKRLTPEHLAGLKEIRKNDFNLVFEHD